MRARRSIRIKGGAAVRARGGIGGAVLAGAWIVVILGLIGVVFWVRSQPDAALTGRRVAIALPPAGPERTEELMRPQEAPPPQPAQPASSNNQPAQPAPTTPAPAQTPPAAPAAPLGGVPLPAAQKPDGTLALAPAPDPALIAPSPNGPLPVIDASGRRAWRAYARPFSAPAGTPLAAIVITGLGMGEAITNAAIDRLPGAVTLSFVAYAKSLQPAIDRARAAGHEVLIELPMEPSDLPQNDPGPLALRTAVPPAQNLANLDILLARGTGYVGAMNFLGARFLAAPDALQPVLAALNARGLMFFDSHAFNTDKVRDVARAAGIPFASGDLALDDAHSRDAIARELAALADTAQRAGRAIGVGGPYPATIEAVAGWAEGLSQRGIALAPLSALAAPVPPTAAPATASAPAPTPIQPAPAPAPAASSPPAPEASHGG